MTYSVGFDVVRFNFHLIHRLLKERKIVLLNSEKYLDMKLNRVLELKIDLVEDFKEP